ncbi:MAG: respiratory chain complex I subunit 1 family protein [Halobacteriota archaeon]
MEWVSGLPLLVGALAIISFAFVMGLLYDYEVRKLFALMQSRRGPLFIVPKDLRIGWGTTRIFQTLYDVLKLFSKQQTFVPNGSRYFVFAPYFVLSCMALTPLLFVIGGFTVFGGFEFSLVVLSYLLFTVPFALIIGGASSASPFGAISIRREMELMLSYEVAFVIGVFSAALLANSLSIAAIASYQAHALPIALLNPFAAAAVFFAIVGKLHLKPFDTTEADTEIVSGYFTEYGSRLLGIFLTARMFLVFALVTLFTNLFMYVAAAPLVLYFVEAFVIVFLLTLVHTITPRYRIDQAIKWFARVPLILAVIGLIWSLLLKYGVFGGVL